MKLTPKVIHTLAHLVGAQNVCTDEVSLSLYGYDCSLSRTRPDGVIHITHPAQVAPVLEVLFRNHVPFVPRASATNHAGSCVSLRGGVILNLTRLNHILEINTREGFAVVEPGVVTGELQRRLSALGYFYAPDPASQEVSTLGGNLAQNASGARCMKYGGTIDHILEATVVLPDGTMQTLSRTQGGPDLIGLWAGSEGTLGVITQLKVKILPLAKHVQTFLVTFPSLTSSVNTVRELVAQGIIPRCVEAMDKVTAQAVEAFAHAGYPAGAESLLILEVDGTPAKIKKDAARLEALCRNQGCLHIEHAKTEEQRAQLWRGRRSAYAAMARLAPNVMVGDGTVPRSELPRALAQVQQLLAKYDVQASLLFHAGDGNFHPHILFDQRNKLAVRNVSKLVREILQICIDCQGTISGEHGIGVEKRALMAQQYDAPTLATMVHIKHALDPKGLANPLKIIPYQFEEKSQSCLPIPDDIKPIAEQLQQFCAQQIPYVIVGENSQLHSFHPHQLSSRTLTKIIEIDTQNYTATAQAGVSLPVLQKALKKAGVYAALPLREGTLGGLFCARKDTLFMSHVTGIEALLPDGSFVRYGGKLMKNAAGYPLTRLWAGSQGTLGLVVQLTFKVFAAPVPAHKEKPFRPGTDNALWARLRREFDPKQFILNTPAEDLYAEK